MVDFVPYHIFLNPFIKLMAERLPWIFVGMES